MSAFLLTHSYKQVCELIKLLWLLWPERGECARVISIFICRGQTGAPPAPRIDAGTLGRQAGSVLARERFGLISGQRGLHTQK